MCVVFFFKHCLDQRRSSHLQVGAETLKMCLVTVSDEDCISVVILWVLLHLLLCLFVLFLLSSARLLKVVNWFPILIWKTRAAFSTRPLLRAVNCAYGQHESCFWCGWAASVNSTLFLLDLLKTAPQGGSEGTAACITRPLSHGGAHTGIVWNWVKAGLLGQQLID